MRRSGALLGLVVGMSLACAGLVHEPRGPLLPVCVSCPESQEWTYADAWGRHFGPTDLTDARRHSEGLAWAKQGDLWGILDEELRWVVAPSLDYKFVSDFSGGAARVGREVESFGMAGLVDRQGVEIAPVEYFYIAPPSEGWMVANTQIYGRCVYLSPSGERSEEFRECGDFSEGYAAVNPMRGRPTYVDTALNPVGREYDEVYPYAEGVAVVRPSVEWPGTIISMASGFEVAQPSGPVTGEWKFIDREGRELGTLEHADTVGLFAGGLAVVRDDRGSWYIRPDGTPAFDRFFGNAVAFSEGLARVTHATDIIEGGFAYIDLSGEVRIPGPFRRASDAFVDGVAFAMPEGSETWGLLDSEGRWVVEPRFDSVEAFRDGWAQVTEGDREWWLHTDGTLRARRTLSR